MKPPLSKTEKLIRYLNTRDYGLNLPPEVIDDAFIRAAWRPKGERLKLTASWETIRVGLLDAELRMWSNVTTQWHAARVRRYQALLGRAKELRRAIQAKDIGTLFELVTYVYPYVQEGGDPVLRPYRYRMPESARVQDDSALSLIAALQASSDPHFQMAFQQTPRFPDDKQRAAWDRFIIWLRNRYGVAP